MRTDMVRVYVESMPERLRGAQKVSPDDDRDQVVNEERVHRHDAFANVSGPQRVPPATGS